MTEFIRPKPEDDKNTLLELYENNNVALKTQIKTKSSDVIRIMTWNIHYWSKITKGKRDGIETPNFKEILNEIVEINPDIVCLQEVNYGKTKYINSDLQEELNSIGYILVSFCNTVGSWFVVPYGNAVIVKKDFLWCGDNDCISVPQRNNVFKVNSQGKSTKCFIETIYKNIKIICTHLDVYDKSGNIRKEQIEELDEYIGDSCPTIILGDFNLVNSNDYNGSDDDRAWYDYISTNPERGGNGEAYNLIKSKGWIDSFDIKGHIPKYTTWNSTRIDYIFFKNFNVINSSYEYNNLIKDSFVNYTTNSDHIPVIVDLFKSEINNIRCTSSIKDLCNKVKIYPIKYYK